jgi:hypothetical protein
MKVMNTWWNIQALYVFSSRSQWPRGLRHELSSPSRTLGSWVRVSLEAWMSVCVYSVFMLLCVVGSGLATGWSPSKESYRLSTRSRIWKSGQGPRKGCRATDRYAFSLRVRGGSPAVIPSLRREPSAPADRLDLHIRTVPCSSARASGFPQSIQASAEEYLWPWEIPSTSFAMHRSAIALSFDAVVSYRQKQRTREREGWRYTSSPSARDGGEWSVSRRGRITHGEGAVVTNC